MPLSERQFTVSAHDGALLRVWEFGADLGPGQPTVVLAHGWTMTHRAWLPVVELLRTELGAHVVVYDQRGHGASTPGPTNPSVRVLGDDLAQVVEVAAPAGPLVLGGHSMGGLGPMPGARQRSGLDADLHGVPPDLEASATMHGVEGWFSASRARHRRRGPGG